MLRRIHATPDRDDGEDDDIDALSSEGSGDDSVFSGMEDFEPELHDL